jgi:hypothetical protein
MRLTCLRILRIWSENMDYVWASRWAVMLNPKLCHSDIYDIYVKCHSYKEETLKKHRSVLMSTVRPRHYDPLGPPLVIVIFFRTSSCLHECSQTSSLLSPRTTLGDRIFFTTSSCLHECSQTSSLQSPRTTLGDRIFFHDELYVFMSRVRPRHCDPQ